MYCFLFPKSERQVASSPPLLSSSSYCPDNLQCGSKKKVNMHLLPSLRSTIYIWFSITFVMLDNLDRNQSAVYTQWHLGHWQGLCREKLPLENRALHVYRIRDILYFWILLSNYQVVYCSSSSKLICRRHSKILGSPRVVSIHSSIQTQRAILNIAYTKKVLFALFDYNMVIWVVPNSMEG